MMASSPARLWDRVMIDDVVAGLPVQEFRSYQGRRHYPGWCWSSMLSRLAGLGAAWSWARIVLADFDPPVTGIAAQPFVLTGATGPGTASCSWPAAGGRGRRGHCGRRQSNVPDDRSRGPGAIRVGPAPRGWNHTHQQLPLTPLRFSHGAR
jgi:hypothetical protein